MYINTIVIIYDCIKAVGNITSSSLKVNITVFQNLVERMPAVVISTQVAIL